MFILTQLGPSLLLFEVGLPRTCFVPRFGLPESVESNEEENKVCHRDQGFAPEGFAEEGALL